MLAILPRPAHLEVTGEQFTFTEAARILVAPGSPEIQAIGLYLSEHVHAATGLKLGVQASQGQAAVSGGVLLTSLEADAKLGAEGYALTATRGQVVIRAPHPAGIFYGVQTLRQLLPPALERGGAGAAGRTIPGITIRDQPRFAWRGYLLDVGRHFRTTDFIKRCIDDLACHKLNVFHWHLTEDQGWRIEIKKYPRLAEVGAWREAAEGRYGGFYTQAEIREVVAYAARRYVTVMPEIEMPGHSLAALSAYPELSCTGGPFQVATKWGVYEDVYCAGQDRTFGFLEDILHEVLALFPSEFIHIGGDECPKARWKKCPRCQRRMQDHQLKDEEALQSFFIRHFDRFLASQKRRLMGWDEILEGGLAPGAAVMSWRDTRGGISAAKLNHDVVMTPRSHCYLNLPIPFEQVYAYEPVPGELSAEQAQHILGAQGNMWSEHTPAEADVDRQTWPRLAGLAEVVWSPAALRDFGDFTARLAVHARRLQALGLAS